LWTNCVARSFSQGGKYSWKRPTGNRRGPPPIFRKKFRNESLSGCGFLCTKTRNHRKTTVQKLPKNAKNNNLLKTKKVLNTEIVYEQNGGAVFAFTYQGRGSHPCTPVSHNTVVDLCCILSLYKNRITGMQSYKIVSVTRACNIQCFLHQSCPLKTRNFTYTIEKSSYSNNSVPSVGLGPLVGRSALFIGPCNTFCGPCLLHWLRGIKHRLL